MNERLRLQILYFNYGGGHYDATAAFATKWAEGHPEWDIELVNVQDLLPLNIQKLLFEMYGYLFAENAKEHPRVTDTRKNIYNTYLKSGLTYFSEPMLRSVQFAIAKMKPLIVDIMRVHFEKTQPSMVLGPIPNYIDPIVSALREVNEDTPYVTIMTDFTDCPPAFWQISPKYNNHYLICGTEIAVQQAERLGYSRQVNLFRMSGMMLHPQFDRPRDTHSPLTLQSLGLDPTATTVLISMGGAPPRRQVLSILKSLERASIPLQAIVMCGDNQKLFKALEGRPRCFAAPHTRTLPPTHDMVAFMDIATIGVSKLGPGTLSQFVARGLPALAELSSSTMIQERGNADWITTNGVGTILKDFKEAGTVIERAVLSGALEQWRRNCSQVSNRACQEAVMICDHIFRESPRSGHASTANLSVLAH